MGSRLCSNKMVSGTLVPRDDVIGLLQWLCGLAGKWNLLGWGPGGVMMPSYRGPNQWGSLSHFGGSIAGKSRGTHSPLGPREAQRHQSSMWNLRLYKPCKLCGLTGDSLSLGYMDPFKSNVFATPMSNVFATPMVSPVKRVTFDWTDNHGGISSFLARVLSGQGYIIS